MARSSPNDYPQLAHNPDPASGAAARTVISAASSSISSLRRPNCEPSACSSVRSSSRSFTAAARCCLAWEGDARRRGRASGTAATPAALAACPPRHALAPARRAPSESRIHQGPHPAPGCTTHLGHKVGFAACLAPQHVRLCRQQPLPVAHLAARLAGWAGEGTEGEQARGGELRRGARRQFAEGRQGQTDGGSQGAARSIEASKPPTWPAAAMRATNLLRWLRTWQRCTEERAGGGAYHVVGWELLLLVKMLNHPKPCRSRPLQSNALQTSPVQGTASDPCPAPTRS
jgi:hypothetical protein